LESDWENDWESGWESGWDGDWDGDWEKCEKEQRCKGLKEHKKVIEEAKRRDGN
jgi:hypothetical protein